MCLPAQRRFTRSSFQWNPIYILPLSGKTLTACNKGRLRSQFQQRSPFPSKCRVSPNVIRAERSEQETDSVAFIK